MTLTQIIMQFLAPPLGFIWLAVFGLMFLRYRFGLKCMIFGVLLLFFSSIPGVGVLISLPLLATNTKWSLEELLIADAIVVPTGGYFNEGKHFVPGHQSLRRGNYGAWLQKMTGLPLVITGGRTLNPEAPAESEVLLDLLGLSPEIVWVEDKAMNSYENAVNLEKGFQDRGWGRRIVLVSSAMHMVRLSAGFRARGFEVIPISVNDQVTELRDHSDFWKMILPSSLGLGVFRRAFYSYSGILYYWVQGRFGYYDLFQNGPSYLTHPSHP